MRRIHLLPILTVLFFCISYAYEENLLEIQLSNPLEIGKESLMFGSIVSVCEDGQANFYVIDKLEPQVFKFSSEGKRLLLFGNEGQGPGDFQRPHRITFTEDGKIVVADELYYLSFFKADGTFLKRIDLNGRMEPGYIGTDSFYAWIWRPDDKQQILCDASNTTVRTFHSVAKGSFSVNVPDSSGRAAATRSDATRSSSG